MRLGIKTNRHRGSSLLNLFTDCSIEPIEIEIGEPVGKSDPGFQKLSSQSKLNIYRKNTAQVLKFMTLETSASA